MTFGGYSGFSSLGDTWTLEWGSAIGVPVPEVASRIIFTAYPNPFRASTTLQYELDHPGLVRLAAFDVQGRRVATPFEGHKDIGQWNHRWRGTDRYGSLLAAGVYYLELTVDRKKKQVLKLILLP